VKYTTKQFSAALSRLASVSSQIAAPVAAGIAAEIDRNFSAGVDPYGRAWAPLRPRTLAKGRHPPPLTHSHDGRDGVHVKPTAGAGIGITSDVPYMGVHQNGDPPRMVARKFIPSGVLPAVWRAIWQAELSNRVRARLASG